MGESSIKPLPDDFAEHALRPLHEIQKHYRVGYTTVRRWRKEAGISFPNGRNGWTSGKFKAAPKPPRKSPNPGKWCAPAITPPPLPDSSLAGRAADHLRRRGFIPVCHLNTINPQADPNIWRVGRRDMSSGEMIDLAEEIGFDCREWARVA